MNINRQKIEILQAKQDISAKRLAELSGVSRQLISTIKTRGTCQPCTAQKIAKAFGVELEDLMD